MSLAIRMQRISRMVHGGSEPRRREHVLQCAPAAHMHVHVAGSHQRQVEFATELLERIEPAAIATRGEQFDRDPEPAGKHVGQPARFGRIRRRARKPEREQASGNFEIPALQTVFPLRRRTPCPRDQAAEPAVTAAVSRKQHATQAILQP